MITLKKIKIAGSSSGGLFSGELEFNNNVNTIIAENGFGKSLIYTGIIWCLGLEQSISRPNDTTIWSDGVIDRVELGGELYNVENSYAELSFITRNNEYVTLHREIKGDSVDRVQCSVIKEGKKAESMILYTSKYNTFGNENISLMRQLYIWANLPMIEVFNSRGPTHLYLENLAPLFFIFQMGGWNDLFADQVRRYGIIDIDPIAVEYVLGLKEMLSERIGKIKLDLASAEYKSILMDSIKEMNQLLVVFSDEKLPGTAKLEDLINLYEKFSLRKMLEEKFNFSFERDLEDIKAKIAKNQSMIDSEEEGNATINNNALLKDKRDKILTLKSQVRKIATERENLILRILDDEYAIKDSSSKLALFKDLQILKKDGVGLMSHDYNCPTCSQNVHPSVFKLVDLNVEEVALSVNIKQMELAALRRSKLEKESTLSQLEIEKGKLDLELKELEGYFVFLDETFSSKKRELIEYIGKLDSSKEEMVNLINLNSKIDALDADLKNKIIMIKNDLDKATVTNPKDESSLLQDFEVEYRKLIKALKLTAFKSVTNLDLSLDDIKISKENDYIPFYKNKPLKRYCSASDQSKIIFAYLLAIKNIAYSNNKSSHLGFCLFDEPLQQNPESDFKQSTIDFLSRLNTYSTGQTVVFTKLDSNDMRNFEYKITEIAGKRFLRKIES